jgi:hypothetical protein
MKYMYMHAFEKKTQQLVMRPAAMNCFSASSPGNASHTFPPTKPIYMSFNRRRCVDYGSPSVSFFVLYFSPVRSNIIHHSHIAPLSSHVFFRSLQVADIPAQSEKGAGGATLFLTLQPSYCNHGSRVAPPLLFGGNG